MAYIVIKGDELYHHGIKGMKWGVRRYQNADGSLKAAGRKRYTEGGPKSLKGNLHRLAAKNYELNEKTYEKMGNKTLASMNRAAKENSLKKAEAADAEKAKRISEKKPLTDEERAARNAKIKKAAIAAGAVAATAALAYAGHKYMKHVNSEADHNLGRAKAEAIIDAFDRSENAKNSNRDKYYAGDIDLATRFRKDIAASDRLHATKRSIDRITNDSDMKRKARNAVVREDLNYARDKALRKKYNRSSYKEAAYGRTRAILDARTTVEERLRDRANEEAERMKKRR